MPVEDGLLVAHRTIETTCDISTGYVGLGVQLAKVTNEGCSVLSDDEVLAVKTSVDRWKQIERYTIRTLREPELDLTDQPVQPDQIPVFEAESQ